MYLVDTNVLSARAPAKTGLTPDVESWMDRHDTQLYLSAITIAEVEQGIAKARRLGSERKADRLTEWLETVVHLYGATVLPLDTAVARMLGQLADQAHKAGQQPGLADLAIAATAARHGYTVLTRNLRHFRSLAVRSHDPFDSLPPGLPSATAIPT